MSGRKQRTRREQVLPDLARGGFIRSLALLRAQVDSFDVYPFSLPAIRHLDALVLHSKVTFFIGENGTGKSTLVEAIAVAAGFNWRARS